MCGSWLIDVFGRYQACGLVSGHQKQLLDPMDKKSLEEKFLKKSSEMNAKYSRDISSILSEFMKLDESKRDPQFDKMFEQLKKYYQMLNPNE